MVIYQNYFFENFETWQIKWIYTQMITAGYLSRILRTTPLETSYAFSSIHHVNPAIVVPFVQVTSFVEVNKIGGVLLQYFSMFFP
jgi:hypothetical protein